MKRRRGKVADAPRTTPSTVAVSAVAFVAAGALVWSLATTLADRAPQVASGVEPSSEGVTADRRAEAPPSSVGQVFPDVQSATDADLAADADPGDAVWYLLDARGRRVHRFSETGALLGSFARRGQGPGELSAPSAIAVHQGAVVVADRRVLHLYELDGTHIADRRLDLDGCFALEANDIDSAVQGLLVLVRCATPAQGFGAAAYLVADDGGVRRLASRSPGGGRFVADLGFVPVISALPNGFVFGDAGADCLAVYDAAAAEAGRACHEWIPRLPISGRAAKAAEAELEPLVQAIGGRLNVPRQLPPFDRVFSLADGRLAYRVPVPLADEVAEEASMFRLVVQDDAGGELALPVPDASAVFAAGESALAAWDELDGVRVAVVPLEGL